MAVHPTTSVTNSGADDFGVDALHRELDELRRTVAAQRTEIDMLRSNLQAYQRDVDQSILYLAQVSNDRWNRANQQQGELKQRLDRYLSIGPFRLLRGLRRRILGIRS